MTSLNRGGSGHIYLIALFETSNDCADESQALNEVSRSNSFRAGTRTLSLSDTILRLRKEQLRLFTFNAVPHLAAKGLCTHR